jgi:hypothetical protein
LIANKYSSAIRAFLLNEQQNLSVYALLFLIGFSVFGTALSFVPANLDDLKLLSAVAITPTPMKFFIGNWGLGDYYRPLHSLTLWFSYQLFGVSAGYHQLLNLILHFVIVCLLFRLIRSVQPDITISFILTSLALVSIYTMSPATWVSDRPTLFVALFFMLLLNHIYKNGQPNVGRTSYIVILSILALMSKESGLIVPLFIIYYSVCMKQHAEYRAKIIIISLIIIAAYGAFRLTIFGSQAFSCPENGYIFGVMHFDNLYLLPKHLQYYAYLENVIKNLIAPIFPVFNWEGGILSISSLISRSPIWFLTLLLVTLTYRKLSSLQKVALAIIVLNSVIHTSLFRYRTQYLSQLAICIFVASSPLLLNNNFNRKLIVKIIAISLLLFNIIWVSLYLNSTLLFYYDMLNKYDLLPVIQESSPRIDNKIVIRVLKKYKVKNPTH